MIRMRSRRASLRSRQIRSLSVGWEIPQEDLLKRTSTAMQFFKNGQTCWQLSLRSAMDSPRMRARGTSPSGPFSQTVNRAVSNNLRGFTGSDLPPERRVGPARILFLNLMVLGNNTYSEELIR